MFVLTFAFCGSARAQTRPPPAYALRATAGAGGMLSDDQRSLLGFRRPALLGNAQLERAVKPWLALSASLHGGTFFAGPRPRGGLLALSLGPTFSLPGRGWRPYAGIALGAGLTGQTLRPHLAVQLGIDARVDARVSVGPALSYGQLVQWNGPRYSTDAYYLWVGLSLRVRLDKAPAPPVQTRVVRVTRVIRERIPAPPPSPPSEEVLTLIERALPGVNKRIELLAPVLFAFDSDVLEPIGVAMLHEVARTLATRPDIARLQIEGYADARGDAEYNRALSQRRAERVRAWLIEHGVAPERLCVAPLGASQLVEPGSDEGAHLQNRRVIFRVLEEAAP